MIVSHCDIFQYITLLFKSVALKAGSVKHREVVRNLGEVVKLTRNHIILSMY